MLDWNKVMSFTGISLFGIIFTKVFSATSRSEMKEYVEDKMAPFKEQQTRFDGKLNQLQTDIDKLDVKIEKLDEKIDQVLFKLSK